MARARLRALGIGIGSLPTGPFNAITDVPGVMVGHSTLVLDEPHAVRTGVTVVLPRGAATHQDYTFAGCHTFNGCGEMTGLPWVEESGLLMSPVALTSTAQVGLVRDALVRYGSERFGAAQYWLPVVAETYDGWLSDPRAFALREHHVYEAMDSACGGPVPEGSVGGGTGMICHGFKGGIGTSSRLVETRCGLYTLAALVQANYGNRVDLRVDGVPVGAEIGADEVPLPWRVAPFSSSIIVVLATDAPLLSHQCRALAKRATVGLARTGGSGHIFSGDIFIAFSTGNHYRRDGRAIVRAGMLPMAELDALYDAAADVTSEAILNALCATDSLSGQEGRTAHALPLGRLVEVMATYRPER